MRLDGGGKSGEGDSLHLSPTQIIRGLMASEAEPPNLIIAGFDAVQSGPARTLIAYEESVGVHPVVSP